MASDEGQRQFYSQTLSSTDLIKKNLVNLLFECTVHKSKSYDEQEKFMFCAKVEDLCHYLLRYTPEANQKELLQWYRQMKEDIAVISKKKEIGQTLKEEILNTRYEYALEVHQHNNHILMNSPIIEVDMEGEIDPERLDKDISVVRNDERNPTDPIISKF